MKYDITKPAAPKMPRLGKGTECIRLLASQISQDMREAIVPMLFPALGAYVSGAIFVYPDGTLKEICGQLGHLVAESGMGKGQLTGAIEAIMRKFRSHDDAEMQKQVEWQRAVKSKGANKDKPLRPDICYWFPPADTTNPAFIQNAMACEVDGHHTQFFSMPEIEMADALCGGHKKVSQVIRNIYDVQRSGALRATADGITGNPTLRVNISLSSTPYSARKFYKNEMFDGTFGRVPISYKARTIRSGHIPRQGHYDKTFLLQLDEYLVRLETCKGTFTVPELNRLIDHMADEMAGIGDLVDEDPVWDMSKRSLTSAWKNGCILYILNGQEWTKPMSDLVTWMVYHDLWSKIQVFGDMFKGGDKSTGEAAKCGPKNMLDELPDTFNQAQLEALRATMEKPTDAAAGQISVWKCRGFIEPSDTAGFFSKTATYLKNSR